MDIREDHTALFNQPAHPRTRARFFDRRADDVGWAVERARPRRRGLDLSGLRGGEVDRPPAGGVRVLARAVLARGGSSF